MVERQWTEYLNSVQLACMPMILTCVGAFQLFTGFRDLVFAEFVLPDWLLIMNICGIAIVVCAGLARAINVVPAQMANLIMFLSVIVMCVKPTVLGVADGTPATILLCLVIFGAGLIFLSLPHLLAMQALAMGLWLSVVHPQIGSPPYYATLAMAFISAVLGIYVYHNRLVSLYANYQDKTRVEELETIIPICSGCRKTRSDEGQWMTLEHFIASKDENHISHGICPGCKESMYGDYLENRDKTMVRE